MPYQPPPGTRRVPPPSANLRPPQGDLRRRQARRRGQGRAVDTLRKQYPAKVASV